jgi:hypothetical protein
MGVYSIDWISDSARWITMLVAVIGGIAAILVAIITYAMNSASSRSLNMWEKQLERTNSQLKDFYGPLLALSQASDEFWKNLSAKHGHSREKMTREQEGNLWIQWVTEIFQPANRKMCDIITQHADLVNEDSMPPCLMLLCAHTSGYDVLIKRWESGDKTEMYSGQNWPDGLFSYLHTSFKNIKEEQQYLLGRMSKVPTWKKLLHRLGLRPQPDARSAAGGAVQVQQENGIGLNPRVVHADDRHDPDLTVRRDGAEQGPHPSADTGSQPFGGQQL